MVFVVTDIAVVVDPSVPVLTRGIVVVDWVLEPTKPVVVVTVVVAVVVGTVGVEVKIPVLDALVSDTLSLVSVSVDVAVTVEVRGSVPLVAKRVVGVVGVMVDVGILDRLGVVDKTVSVV